MIPSAVPGGESYMISPEAKAKYDQQFYQLKPMNGYITGDQAKTLFLQSGLPPAILGKIWSLADRNADGKMDCSEFAIAMHLIQMKLKGIEVPNALPPALQPGVFRAAAPVLSAPGFRPPVAGGVAPCPATVAPSMAPLGVGFIRPASPVDAKLQRSGSISSQDSPSLPAPLTEWAVPQHSKLKYTQLFNSYDRTRTGFLTGAQAKNILVSTGLSQPILAQIWSLSDFDSDGRLSTEEFVLAMHLAECVKAGDTVPRALPPELIPPSHRRKRSTSIVSTSSSTSHAPIYQDINLLGDMKDDKLLQQTTFEDKRRENFEKGQAELEKRRLALLESQRKEQEERDRKEREEQERRERIRQEQERRRQLELEKQLAKQRELELEKEEQRRKALEQREAARREMERQRQLEWEKQRQQELLTQRQKEQESVCHLKNRNKNLTYELEQLSGKIIELNEKITETRRGVTEMKSSIDGMRIDRDSKLNEMNEVKAKIKEMNDRLLVITQEKFHLKSQLQESFQSNPTSEAYSTVMHSFNNKQISINRLQTTLTNIQKETEQKQKDIENNNSQLQELKTQLTDLLDRHKNLYEEYQEKKEKVLELKKSRENTIGVTEPKPAEVFDDAWGSSDTNAVVNDSWAAFGAPSNGTENLGKGIRYRVLYAFEARNPDELSIMPGDIVVVPEGQSSEPGWLGGELHGKKGWFPEAYAEVIESTEVGNGDGNELKDAAALPAETVHIVGTEMKRTLEGISEAPESIEVAEIPVKNVLQQSENSSFTQLPKTNQVVSPDSAESPVLGQNQAAPEGLQAQALFPWKAKKENHLSFNKNDIIDVKEQQDMWWYGDFQGKSGWFPKSYVKLISGPMRTNDNAVENALQNDITEPPEITTTPPSGATDYYVATYAYQSQEPGDLCFQPGETIFVTKKEGEWWTGAIGDVQGIFPSNYVRQLEPHELQSLPPPPPKQEPDSLRESPLAAAFAEGMKPMRKAEIVSCIAPYKATGQEQLSLERGQLVQVRKKSSSGWWEGELQVKGRKRQVGWFPASYVRAHIGSAASSARSTPEPRFSDPMINGLGFQASKPFDRAVALYPFVGQHSDELSFQKGDIITVVDREDPSWWKGELNGKEGLFPSSYVEPLLQTNTPTASQCFSTASDMFSNLNPQERKRQQLIHELINTEESYMEDMSIVLDAFHKPLREALVLSKDELRSIFVNWKELIVCNTKFLRALRVRRRMSSNNIIQMIGDILCENIPRMKPYIRFCSCQLSAAALIQSKSENNPLFKDVTKKCCTDPRTKGMPLSSFLLKPMQRITRYPLLIRKIQECTPKDHPDHSQLEESLMLAEQLCNQVNEGVRERENSDRLEWIQNHVSYDGLLEQITFNSSTNCLGPRKLLHVGILYKAKSNKELMAFLFNDFLLLTQPLTSLGKIGNVFQSDKAMTCLYKMYKKPIFLNEISLKTSDVENNQDDNISFVICYSDRIHVKTSPSDRSLWIKKIEDAAASYVETERKNLNHQKMLRSQSMQGVGRLLVVIIEGSNLRACTNGQSNPYCEVCMGSQEHKTKVIPNTLNPRWNASMQFVVKDLYQDVLCISVFDRDLFSPNEFLGRTEIRVSSIYSETRQTHEPVVKKLPLYEVETGEVIIKLDLQFFEVH